MLPSLKIHFDAIEHQRTALATRLRGLDDATFRRRAAAGGWSVADVVEHLVLVEESQLRHLDRNGAPDTRATSRARTAAALLLIRGLFAVGVRLKAPIKAIVPTGAEHTLAELEKRWGEARCRLAGRLDAVTGETSRTPFARHPIAGWLTLDQWLRFVDDHTRRHQRQLDALL